MQRIAPHLQQHPDLPLILFLTVNADVVARPIAAVCLPLGRDIFFACNLTCDDEKVFHLRSRKDLDSLPPPDPLLRLVLIIGPRPEPEKF